MVTTSECLEEHCAFSLPLLCVVFNRFQTPFLPIVVCIGGGNRRKGGK